MTLRITVVALLVLSLWQGSASAADAPIAAAIAFHNVHVRVADADKAAAWYVAHLDAQPGDVPFRVLFGEWFLIFFKDTAAGPKAGGTLDHIGVTVVDVGRKVKELQAAGARISKAPGRKHASLTSVMMEDPWGVRIELIQNAKPAVLHHVHLNVRDPQAALTQMRATFGGQAEYSGTRLQALRYSDVRVYADDLQKPQPTDVHRNHAVMWCLALGVADISAAYTALVEAGITVPVGPGSTPIMGKPVKYVFVDVPGDIDVELLERPQ